MTSTVVGVFDRVEDAQSVVQELIDAGIPRDGISLVANDASGTMQRSVGGDKMDNTTEEQAGSGAIAGAGVGGVLGLLVGLGALAIPGIGPVVAAGPIAAALGSTALGAGIGAAAGGLVGPLVEAGVPRPEAEQYNESVRRGSTLVTVQAPDTMVDEALMIMERHNVVDIDRRGETYRQEGWTGTETAASNGADRATYAQTAAGTTMAGGTTAGTNVGSTARTNTTSTDETVLPIVEEQLTVGKRDVERGRARVHTVVTERPVEEQVRLREERVVVERRPVDRPIDANDTAFVEQEFEVTERSEQAVVGKQARVVEEVVIGKQVEERVETVRDTVRRTDVEVDRDATATSNGSATTTGTMGDDDTFYRSYYDKSLTGSGYSYDQYRPVFTYGSALATTYKGRNWNEIETDVRRDWEAKNAGTWEQFKDSIKFAWDRATNRR